MAQRKIIRGGELPKTSGSGVTIGDHSLEEFVADEEAKEFGETLVPDNLATYHKSHPKYAEQKGHRGPTRVYTRREINAMEWEKIMEAQKNIEGVIAALLLSGREVTGREIQNNAIRQLNITKKKYSQRSTYLFHKTDFGKFITSRRDGKGACYKLVPAALECKVEELLFFVHKSNPEARKKVLEHHKGLSAYLEPDVKEKKEEAKEKFLVSSQDKKPDIVDTINSAVAQELGVNVNVQGRVEIVFKWE